MICNYNMYKFIESFIVNFRNIISVLFEVMTCRTKPDYQACNSDEQDVYVNFES